MIIFGWIDQEETGKGGKIVFLLDHGCWPLGDENKKTRSKEAQMLRVKA